MLVSYDVMLPDVASVESVRIKQVWDSASASEGKRAYLLEATTKGKITINGTELCDYVPGQWYNITEVVDVTNKKIYAYVDGKYIKKEYDWRNDDNGVANGINRIQTQLLLSYLSHNFLTDILCAFPICDYFHICRRFILFSALFHQLSNICHIHIPFQ